MQNLYQIKRAGELVAKEIPQNCSLLLKSVGGNLKGTVIAAMVSDELTDAATQMTALFPFMKQLVTSGKYDVTGDDGKNETHKVNLLNASERYYICLLYTSFLWPSKLQMLLHHLYHCLYVSGVFCIADVT